MDKLLTVLRIYIALLLGSYLGMWTSNILFDLDNSVFTSPRPYIIACIITMFFMIKRSEEEE